MDAAVDAACSKAECAVLSATNEPELRRYELVSINDEPGELVVRRLGDGEVQVECRIGRFDGSRSRAMADAVRDRLRQLHGVGAVPIR